jgi:hypothetical protein
MAKSFNLLRAKMSPARLAQNERRALEMLAEAAPQEIRQSLAPKQEQREVIIVRYDLSEILNRVNWARVNWARLLYAKSLF